MGNEDKIPPELFQLMGSESPTRGITYEWLARLMDVVEHLDRDDRIKIEQFETHPPVGQFVRETLSDSAAFPIPDAILSFYNIIDGFELRWSLPSDETSGHIRMCGFGEVFGNWTDSLWGVVPEDELEDEEEVDFSWDIRGIEDGGAHDFVTVMHTPESMPSFHLYFRNPTQRTYRLNTDFLGYLDLLLEMRGVQGWQYLVCDVDYTEDAEALEHAMKATSVLRQLFPEVDLSRFNLPDE